MSVENQLVKDIGEQGLLKLIRPFCAAEIVGDDGAVLDVTPGYKLVVTTDVLVDRVHFSDRTTPAFFVGWRSAAANLSDLAAMGANPLGITVGLSLPGNVPTLWVKELYRGLSACLEQFHTPIVGGDITRSDVITVAITAMGEVKPDRVITRSAAKPGDAILITGYHGLSRAGLELLLNPKLGNNLTSKDKDFLISAHQQPQPRLDVLAKLREIAPNAAVAGMDSSDGLGDAIAQICRCSNLGAEIDWAEIPQHPDLAKLTTHRVAKSWILDGGEDFELVLCLKPQLAECLLAELEIGAAIIGYLNQRLQLTICDRNQRITREIGDLTSGFQHFS